MHVSFEILNLLGFPKEQETSIGGPKPAEKSQARLSLGHLWLVSLFVTIDHRTIECADIKRNQSIFVTKNIYDAYISLIKYM
jgi:hypothetical protein